MEYIKFNIGLNYYYLIFYNHDIIIKIINIFVRQNALMCQMELSRKIKTETHLVSLFLIQNFHKYENNIERIFIYINKQFCVHNTITSIKFNLV